MLPVHRSRRKKLRRRLLHAPHEPSIFINVPTKVYLRMIATIYVRGLLVTTSMLQGLQSCLGLQNCILKLSKARTNAYSPNNVIHVPSTKITNSKGKCKYKRNSGAIIPRKSTKAIATYQLTNQRRRQGS